MFYSLARVYKYVGALEDYYENLEKALENKYTLSFSRKIVRQELQYVEQKIDRKEQIEPETRIEDYSEIEDEEEDFEEEELDDGES